MKYITLTSSDPQHLAYHRLIPDNKHDILLIQQMIDLRSLPELTPKHVLMGVKSCKTRHLMMFPKVCPTEPKGFVRERQGFCEEIG